MTFSRIAVTAAAVLVSVICLIFLADGARVFYASYTVAKSTKAMQDTIEKCRKPVFEDAAIDELRMRGCINSELARSK